MAEQQGSPAVERVIAQVRAAGNPQDAQGKAAFMGGVPGGYAEHDVFLGVRVPVLRKIARELRDQLSLSEVEALCLSELHEVRLLAAILLVQKYQRNPENRAQVVELLLARAEQFNNWDLVDSVAPYTLGPWLLDIPAAQRSKLLRREAASDSLWRRRIAVLSTLGLIRGGCYQPTLELAELLLDDEHHLIHKAVGWMLREVGKRDRALLDEFLAKHAPAMPRTMLRYAIEQHDAAQRAHYLQAAG